MSDHTQDLVIIKLDHINHEFAEAITIQQTTTILDKACAVEIYAKRHRLGKDAIAYAYAIKLEAMRRLGELIIAMPKAKGGQPYQARPTGSKSEPVATLAALGITKKLSMVSQQLAKLPQAAFERVREGATSLTQALWEARHPHETNGTTVAWSLEAAEDRLKRAINAEIDGATPEGANDIVMLLRRLTDELERANRPEIRDAVEIARRDLDVHDAEPGGFRIFETEEQAATHPGAPHVIASCKSTHSRSYKDLTTKKDGGTALSRRQYEARLTDLDKGKLPTKRTARTHFAVHWAIKDLAR